MTKEELTKLLELLTEAYKEAGRTIVTAELHQGEAPVELLIDNRKEEDIH